MPLRPLWPKEPRGPLPIPVRTSSRPPMTHLLLLAEEATSFGNGVLHNAPLEGQGRTAAANGTVQANPPLVENPRLSQAPKAQLANERRQHLAVEGVVEDVPLEELVPDRLRLLRASLAHATGVPPSTFSATRGRRPMAEGPF